MCPSSVADDCEVLLTRVGNVPWLQEGCQDWLAGCVSIEEFVAQRVIKCCKILFKNLNTSK